ncbi:MAG TPA: hypothetical protein PK014_08020 [Thermoanaerobaculia bacterium]|nr:hypothetical protein [Thermoanaerobaculia bacterium]HUM30053.1 hypothetical protein [Thermoanaerobaculia bacterium]HXK68258.1 hypothetical protein [Thermoanaerobaculia bacterium]
MSPLIPQSVVEVSGALQKSIEICGILEPVRISNTIVVDGLRRMAAALALGLDDIPVQEISGDPHILRWHLNLTRPWNLLETAHVYKGLKDSQKKAFLSDLSMGDSPSIPAVMDLLVSDPSLHPAILEGRMTLAALRDLAASGSDFRFWVKVLLEAKGTVGERRVAASLVRDCVFRETLPGVPAVASVKDVIAWLHPLAHPETDTRMNELNTALGEVNLPPGVRVHADPTLEREGVELSFRVTRRDLSRLEEIRQSLARLFEKLDFL